MNDERILFLLFHLVFYEFTHFNPFVVISLICITFFFPSFFEMSLIEYISEMQIIISPQFRKLYEPHKNAHVIVKCNQEKRDQIARVNKYKSIQTVL